MKHSNAFKAVAAVLFSLYCANASPQAAPAEGSTREPLFTRDMTERELHNAITQAMPFHVISILFTVKDGKRHFAVNMRGDHGGVFNVTWHVPTSADRQLIMKSLQAAKAYAADAAHNLNR